MINIQKTISQKYLCVQYFIVMEKYPFENNILICLIILRWYGYFAEICHLKHSNTINTQKYRI